MLSPFPFSLWKPPYDIPCSLTHPLLLPCPCIPLHWGIEPWKDQGPLLPLMTNKAILCYICDWSHEFLHVNSLVGSLVPGSSWCTGGSYCCSSYGAANPFSSLDTFSSSFFGDPVLHPMDGCEHPLLYLSGTGRASQEIALPDSCQQALVGIHNSV